MIYSWLLKCVAASVVCCSVLQCVAVSALCCIISTIPHTNRAISTLNSGCGDSWFIVAVCCSICSVLQCVAISSVCCIPTEPFQSETLVAGSMHSFTTLLHTATHCNTLQHPTSYQNSHFKASLWLWWLFVHLLYCYTPQHTATHCNTLQYPTSYQQSHFNSKLWCRWFMYSFTTLLHTAFTTPLRAATRCNTLQHAATHCGTPQHPTNRAISTLNSDADYSRIFDLWGGT